MNYNSDINTREDIARREFQNFSRNRAVLLAYTGELGRANAIASGTLVQTPGGNLCALTARHIYDDWSLKISGNSSNLTILLGDGALPDDCIHGYIVHPELDVMLIVLSSMASNSIKNVSLPSRLISLDFEEILKGDCFFLAGFPSDLETMDFNQKVQDFPYLMVPYGAQDVKLGEQKVILNWESVERDSRSVLKELKEPHGMSGSPVWKCRALGPNKLWCFELVTRLVGIQESWDPKTKEIFIVPLEKWNTWLSESMKKIDGLA